MQKKILPLCLALLAFLPLTAQVKKGTVLLGAGVNISTSPQYYLGSNSKDSWQRRTQFQLEAGKAIKDNLVAGVRLGTGTAPVSEYARISGGYVSSYSNARFYSGELFLKKYAPIGKKFAFFAEAAITGTASRYKSEGSSYFGYSDIKLRQVSLSGSMGITYNLSKRVMLEFTFNNLVSFHYSKTKGAYTDFYTREVTPVNDSYLSMNPFNGVNRSGGLGIKIRLGKQ